MVLCNHCNLGYHLECMGLLETPEEDWYCEHCLENIHESLNTNTYIDQMEDLELIAYIKGTLNLNFYPIKT